jgi:hypothetical protein
MDDYMSEKYLLVVEEKPKKKLKRKFDDKPRSITELQKERLEEGLSNPLDSTNKGFRMLAAMGFKEGDGLGKSNPGIKEPLPLVIKQGRAGLAEEKKKEFKKPRVEIKDVNQFNSIMSNKAKDKKIIKAIITISGKTCPSLDERANIVQNDLLADWNTIQKNRDEGLINFSFEDFLNKESIERRLQRLEDLLEYMRKTHFYCTFCAHTYDNYDQLIELCPGLWEDDH